MPYEHELDHFHCPRRRGVFRRGARGQSIGKNAAYICDRIDCTAVLVLMPGDTFTQFGAGCAEYLPSTKTEALKFKCT
jgi:hypothetical protein